MEAFRQNLLLLPEVSRSPSGDLSGRILDMGYVSYFDDDPNISNEIIVKQRDNDVQLLIFGRSRIKLIPTLEAEMYQRAKINKKQTKKFFAEFRATVATMSRFSHCGEISKLKVT